MALLRRQHQAEEIGTLRPIPPIDAEAPAETATATFAAG